MTFGSAAEEAATSSAYLLDLYDHAPQLKTLEPDELAGRLDEGHDNIEHAFENIVTDDCRTLFEEIK